MRFCAFEFFDLYFFDLGLDFYHQYDLGHLQWVAPYHLRAARVPKVLI